MLSLDFYIDPADCMQEYRCLLTLEGLQAITEQCLHRLQELRAGETPSPPTHTPLSMC